MVKREAHRSFDEVRSPFLGRAAELAALDEWRAGTSRCLNVVGPAGAGKSRLVREWAGRRTLLCDLEGVRDELALERRLASALSLALPARGEPDACLSHALAARGPLVLILDGADGLSMQGRMARWLDAAPELRILLTLRRPPRPDDESLFVGRMRDEDAYELFVHRLGRELAGEEREHARQLMRRLDALPLAVEILAGLALGESLQQLVDSLPADLGLVGDDGSSLRRTHLRSVVARSLRALELPLLDALRALSLLAPVIEAEDACALAAPEHVHLLAALGLVSAQEDGRLRIPRAISERLEEPGEQLRRSRVEILAAKSTQSLRDLERARPARACAFFDGRFDALVDAARDAVALGMEEAAALLAGLGAHLGERGPTELLERLFDEALAALPQGRVRAEALLARGAARVIRGRGESARADLEEARSWGLHEGDRLLADRALLSLAAVLRQAREGERAEEMLSEALSLTDDPALRARLLFSRANAELASGRPREALATWNEALPLADEAELLRTRAATLANAGLVLLKFGRLEEGIAACEAAIESHDAAGAKAASQRVLINLAIHTALAGRFERSSEFLGRLDATLDECGEGDVTAGAQLAWTLYRRARGERGLALRHARLGLRLARAVGAASLAQDFEALRHELTDIATLRVGEGGAWFEPQGGERVDLTRRGELRRIFGLLCDKQGQVIPIVELLQRGWPDESHVPEDGAERVETAILALRKMGLAGVLQTVEGGYRMDPAVRLARG